MKKYQRSNSFTLIELLVAMSVLVIIVVLLFQILNHGRNAWSAIERNSRVYENARIALDLITRDLQSAVVCEEQDREIPFYTGLSSGNNNERIAFVASSSRTNSAHSKLAEIRYRSTTSGPYAYWLRRSAYFDYSGSGPRDKWDFYGDIGTGDSLAGTGTAFQRIVLGVEEIRFVCYDQNNNIINEDETLVEKPTMIWVSLTLFDPRAADPALPEVARDKLIRNTRRTFNKRVHLKL